MDVVLEVLTLIIGIATGIAVAWLVLNGVMLLAFRRPTQS